VFALVLTSATVFAPGAAERDHTSQCAHRCELLLQRALVSSDEYVKRCLASEVVGIFSRRGLSMSHGERQRIALLSAAIVETAESWDAQSTMIWIIDHGLNDSSARALCTPMRELIPSAKKSDFELSMKPSLMGPRGGSSAPYLEFHIKRLNMGVPPFQSSKQK
jgi:hypothetical protein